MRLSVALLLVFFVVAICKSEKKYFTAHLYDDTNNCVTKKPFLSTSVKNFILFHIQKVLQGICQIQGREYHIMFESNSTHILTKQLCEAGCTVCKHNTSSKIGCLPMGKDKSYDIISPNLPKITETGYYQHVHRSIHCPENDLHVVFTVSGEQCRNLIPHDNQHQNLMKLNKRTVSTHHKWNQEKQRVEEIEFSARDCKGEVVVKKEYELNKCYLIFSFSRE
jgi:hypothetical protein